MNTITGIRRITLAVLAATTLLLHACGGGAGEEKEEEQETTPSYTVSGTVSGLTGDTLILQLYGYKATEGSNEITITADGAFTFPVPLIGNTRYSVVAGETQNQTQYCEVTQSLDGLINSDITDVTVVCEEAYHINGRVEGFEILGTHWASYLHPTIFIGDEAGNPRSFPVIIEGLTFQVQQLANGESWHFEIEQPPVESGETCRLENGSGVIDSAHVENVIIACSDTHTIGGTVTGLTEGEVVLANNQQLPDGQILTVSASEDFTFIYPLASGTSYDVTVLQQPENLACTVSNGTGTVRDTDVTNIEINCQPPGPITSRAWIFNQLSIDGSSSTILEQSPNYPEYRRDGAGLHQVFAESVIFGTDDDEGDHIVIGEVYSNTSGSTYWVSSQAPLSHPGVVSQYEQRQSFRKLESQNSMQLLVTGLQLELNDANPHLPDCPWLSRFGGDHSACIGDMSASVWMYVDLIRATGEDASARHQVDDRYPKAISAEIRGRIDDWHFHRMRSTADPLLSSLDPYVSFLSDTNLDGRQTDASVELLDQIPIDLDLSSIPTGEEFTVALYAMAKTHNRVGRESWASAYLRDPQSFSSADPQKTSADTEVPGLTLVTSGLETTNNPYLGEIEPAIAEPRECEGEPGSGGLLQFNSGTYYVVEQDSTGQTILIERTENYNGQVQATVTVTGGSAVEGVDYEPFTTTVIFREDDDTPFAIQVPMILDDDIEEDKTLTLALTEPGGCVTLDGQITALVHLIDDDTPAPIDTFHISGTVNGLTGSGLQIANEYELETLTLEPGATSFAFSFPVRTGFEYNIEVETNPTNPDQVCSVTNGSGIMGDADVTNVVIDCEDAPPAPSGLDPEFGDNGKVYSPLSVAFSEDTLDMGLQSDGGIIIATGNAITRYHANGVLDESFGTDGVTSFVIGTDPTAYTFHGLAIQDDDRIVLAGRYRPLPSANSGFMVMRLNADGSLDETFGTDGGMVTTEFFTGGSSFAQDVVIQDDGKILAVGQASDNAGIIDMALARYTADGALDPTWGGDGTVTTDTQRFGLSQRETAAAVAIDGDNILVVGNEYDGTGFIAGYTQSGDLNPLLIRGIHEPCNTPTGWIPTGWFYLNVNPNSGEYFRGLALGSRIYVASYFDGNAPTFRMLALQWNGHLDLSCTPPPPDEPYIGYSQDGLTGAFAYGSVVHDIAMMPDDRVLLAGHSFGDTWDFGIARFVPDDPATTLVDESGGLDPEFGDGGVFIIDFFEGSDSVREILVQPDGKILAAGLATNGSQRGLGIVRIIP